jgi:hypothetical protein
MVQVHGRRVSKRLHHLQSRVVFIVVVVVVVVWRRARHFVGRREREREWGDRKTFEIQTLLQFALFSLLLFTFHRRKKRVVVVESLFVEALFRSLFVCARDFTSSPGVCDATLKREINFKQKKNVIWRELRSTREKEEQKKESFLEG